MTNTNKEINLNQLEIMIQEGFMKQFEESDRKIYYVSKFGNFYSQSKNNLEKIMQMKLSPDGEGYLRTNIKGKTVKVHIVVAETFIRPRKPGEVVNHLNPECDRTMNNVENLEITTQSLNAKHAWDVTKERRRLTPEKAEQIRMLHAVEGLSFNAIARMMDCTATSIKQVIEGRTFNKNFKKP
ncbi:hypothetical protein [Staphylococcus cohnii]|uniref:hypothetical protein n=1 Tax=Staphylococcus cohnii TaxID=29382 RepID=UPI003D7D7F4A